MKKIICVFAISLGLSNLMAQKSYVLFGSYNWDTKTEGIYIFKQNIKSGKLTKVSGVKSILNPSFLTFSNNGDYVYACTESKIADSGSVSSFKFDPIKGQLKFVNTQKTGAENPVYLSSSKDGKWLVNANYGDSSFAVFPIAKDGSLEANVQNIHYSEGSIDPDRQTTSHLHSAVFSPDGKQVFFPDLGADKIRIFDFKSDLAQPLQPSKQEFMASKPGNGPRHLTFHPNGKFAYCINELSGTLDVFSYENSTLKSIQSINSHEEKNKDTFESSDVHLSPDGKFLYATNRGRENNIGIFSVNTDGTLKKVGFQSTFGKHPRTFTLTQNGDFLIVPNVQSNNITVFKRNAETGLLTKIQIIKNIAHPTHVIQRMYN